MSVARRYETIFIARPELSPDDVKTLNEKVTDIIARGKGQVIKLDEWGVRRLAYEVKKQTRGFYCYLDYCGNQALVKELERNLKIDDRVMKYLTVKLEEAFSPESLQTETGEEKTDEQKKEEPVSAGETPTEMGG